MEHSLLLSLGIMILTNASAAYIISNHSQQANVKIAKILITAFWVNKKTWRQIISIFVKFGLKPYKLTPLRQNKK